MINNKKNMKKLYTCPEIRIHVIDAEELLDTIRGSKTIQVLDKEDKKDQIEYDNDKYKDDSWHSDFEIE